MTKEEFQIRRKEAINSFKKANYDPYTTFINLQALHLDTKEDANNVISYLRKVDAEIRQKEKENNFLYVKKRATSK